MVKAVPHEAVKLFSKIREKQRATSNQTIKFLINKGDADKRILIT